MNSVKADVIPIRPNTKVEGDPIFFKKEQIREGVALVYYGRHAPGTVWIVKRILHFYNEGPNRRNSWAGRLRHRRVSSPETLMDAVVLHCENGAKMELTFQYLSYSAIWRLS